MFETHIEGETGVSSTLYSEDFESGGLGPEWSIGSSSPNGRIGVSDTLGGPANSGAFHLVMDATPAGAMNLNEAIISVDLSGISEAQLTFAHKDVNDEDTALPATFVGSFNGDGVSISVDGTTWHTLISLDNSNSANNLYTPFSIDLAAAASTAGISLGADFQIKFQQYDNFPFNSDGRAFDDVAITVPGVVAETTSAFLEADQTLTVIAAPQDSAVTLTAIVRDPDDVVVATATAASPGEPVEIETVDIAVDGVYSVEVASDAATEYDLS
ncbi:MAG: hypothetical protein KDA42_15975, partial [Planctomycetales bacterium]|nr:hypothetical protein [Planctomycetales bacterium]